MSDPHLNNVMLQYYPDATSITTNFLGSTKLPGPVGAEFNRDSVNPVIQSLIDNNTLSGTNFDNADICLFLPPGVILTTDAPPGKGFRSIDCQRQGMGLHRLAAAPHQEIGLTLTQAIYDIIQPFRF